ncbi:MAG: hypothetical protein K8T90_11120 [Planctomycetes bacterium]|nr:hypothetical protein [Planctomycetota bacterium]
MRRRPIRVLVVPALSLAAWTGFRPALADVDAEIRSGDAVTGTISPASETETFRVTIPNGAALSVKAKGLKKAKSPRIEILAPTDVPIFGPTPPASFVTKLPIQSSGLYRVLVRSVDGVATGDYSFSAKWTTPKPAARTVVLAAAGETLVPAFSVDGGARVKIEVKAAGGGTLPRIVSLVGPGGAVALGVDALGATTERAGPTVLSATGDYVLHLDDQAGVGGSVTVKITVSPPKSIKRKIDITAKKLGTSDTGAYARVIDGSGGAFEVPDDVAGLGTIAGTSINVPPGALPAGTAIFVGTSPGFDVPKLNDTPLGPPVSFGPDGLKFGTKQAPEMAGVSIPLDLTAVGGDKSKVRVFLKSSNGKVEEIPFASLDFDAKPGFVTFPAPHFSIMQVVTTEEVTPPTNSVTTLVGGLNGGFDIAYSLLGDDASRLYFLADGSSQVKEVVASGIGPGASVQSYAGGGTITAEGTPKAQFSFGAAISAVYSTTDAVYAAAANKLYRIDGTTGLVTTHAGTGAVADGADGSPATSTPFFSCVDVFEDSNSELFLVDSVAGRVRKIDATGNFVTVVGTGVTGSNGDGNPANATKLQTPVAITEGLGTSDYFICELGRVRIWHSDTNTVATLAGDPNGATGCPVPGASGTAARFNQLSGIAFDPIRNRVYVSSEACDVISAIDVATGNVTVVYGTVSVPGFTPDGAATASSRVTDPRALLGVASALTFLDFGSTLANDVRIRLLVLPQ